MSGKHSKGKHYYICKKSLTNICDNKIHLSELNLENYLLNNIINIINVEIKKYEVENIEKKNQKEKISKAEKIKIVKNKMGKIANLYLEEIIDIDYYKKEYEKLKLELENIENEKENELKKIDYTSLKKFLDKDFSSVYNTLDNKEKRELWLSIIDRIVFNSKKDIQISLRCTN